MPKYVKLCRIKFNCIKANAAIRGDLYFWSIYLVRNKICISIKILSRDRSVGIAAGYGLDDQGVGVRVQVGARIFISPCRPDRLWDPPSQWVLGALSPEIKRLGREADHSPPTGAEAKKTWIYTSTPPYVLRCNA
jgi:hypothetical protein